MASSSINIISKPITVTATDYGKTNGSCLMKVGRLVSGMINITIGTQVPQGSWERIGYVGILPTALITVPCADTWNGSYAGLMQINTSGNILVFTTFNIPSDHQISATVSFIV